MKPRLTEVHVLIDSKGSVAQYGFPGGHEFYYLTTTNNVLCSDCVQANLSECCDPDYPDSFIEGFGVNYEDEFCYCDNCSRNIEPQYTVDQIEETK
mgnify:FL=1